MILSIQHQYILNQFIKMTQQTDKQNLKLLRRNINQQDSLYKLVRPEVLKKHDFLNDPLPQWRGRRSDLTDYFNYGFNELTFQLYINKLDSISEQYVCKLQQEYTPKKIFKISGDNIPLDFGGLQIPFDSRFLPNFEPNFYQTKPEEILYANLKPFQEQWRQIINDQDPSQYSFGTVTRNLNLQSEEQLLNPPPPPPPPPTAAKDDLIFLIEPPLEPPKVKKQKIEGPEGELESRNCLPIKKEKKQKKKDKKSKKEKKKKHKKKHKKQKLKKKNEQVLEQLQKIQKFNVKSLSSSKEENENKKKKLEEANGSEKNIQEEMDSLKSPSIQQQQILKNENNEQQLSELGIQKSIGDEQRQRSRGKDWPLSFIQGLLQGQRNGQRLRQ